MNTLKYYREPNGDYLAMDISSIAYYKRIGKPNMRECRATAIGGLPMSICTTASSVEFLACCRRVKLEDIPKEYPQGIF